MREWVPNQVTLPLPTPGYIGLVLGGRGGGGGNSNQVTLLSILPCRSEVWSSTIRTLGSGRLCGVVFCYEFLLVFFLQKFIFFMASVENFN